MRADAILDCTGSAGESVSVIDDFFPRQSYRLLDLVHSDEPPMRSALLAPPGPLPANPLALPDRAVAERSTIVFTGGAMGRLAEAELEGTMRSARELATAGYAWAINGKIGAKHSHEPLLRIRRGRSCVLELVNETAWVHPMHLHGHAFVVTARNGSPAVRLDWRDTALLGPRERIEIAFVADNPGAWMLHCHVLEHQAGGMMATIAVD
jgi:FtsP/CotA-like multicopper oxidase with cupredoxin domain